MPSLDHLLQKLEETKKGKNEYISNCVDPVRSPPLHERQNKFQKPGELEKKCQSENEQNTVLKYDYHT